MRDDTAYVKHIAEAIAKIERYVAGLSYESFAKDEKTIDAVVRELEIIGEAASNVSGEFKRAHPKIPFRDAADMRNRLIHEYFGVNLKIVWTTVTEDLPKLKETIRDFAD